jgi:hypothetical protein
MTGITGLAGAVIVGCSTAGLGGSKDRGALCLVSSGSAT